MAERQYVGEEVEASATAPLAGSKTIFVPQPYRASGGRLRQRRAEFPRVSRVNPGVLTEGAQQGRA